MGDRLSMADFSAVPPLPEWAADAGKRPDLPSGMKEKAENDARWINEFADSLTVAIALHEWEDAVVLVEQGTRDHLGLRRWTQFLQDRNSLQPNLRLSIGSRSSLQV